ncbi:hypothetical protein RB24_05820 [Herbaspirillum rubrisubalbicans]|uniref:Uncharacterized protein n=1 Tax=Herbaspirillum rubrisubalbicans TaxID=80842 RepID=A0ABX9C540_9BURK|nr:hypothetical protein RB24_05820 [Herbaspirillum rubrisubalbicans]
MNYTGQRILYFRNRHVSATRIQPNGPQRYEQEEMGALHFETSRPTTTAHAQTMPHANAIRYHQFE